MFPRIRTVIKRAQSTNVGKKINHVQEIALNESCILVDQNDKIIGKESKYNCHKVGIDGDIPLHRAFSVFIFNSRNEMLLQKRSEYKVTFPGFVSNACCSHPLFDANREMEEENAIGVRIAALRRLHHELGIPKDELNIDDLKYLTRIHYKFTEDGVWGEHEIDYILFMHKDLTINPNPNEVSKVYFVQKNDINLFINNLSEPISPWFKLILKNRLSIWWENIHYLESFYDHVNINTFDSAT